MKVAFIGHRNIEKTQPLKDKLTETIENLILNENACTFIFGNKSAFDDLCYDVVKELKDKYPQIRRIYARASYEYLDDFYKEYLLSLYEDTFFPINVHNAGALSYIKRNQSMIDTCDVLVTYCDENYIPKTKRNSGTKIAVEYAYSKHKRVINVFAEQ